MSNYLKLQETLKEIFEMDKADLDFGIYRIMNQKREQVMDFIDRHLPKDIKNILSETQSGNQSQLREQLEKLGKSLDDAGVPRESAPKYQELLAQLNQQDTTALEQEVFSHLANFFKRYYKDGDFISLRRYKKDVYAIPYEGEEVKLHWANHDQYYIKTSEYLKNYTFKLSNGKKIHFKLKEASTEQNNNKTQGDAERRFAIYEELPVEVIEGELYVNFTYEPHKKAVKQDDLQRKALDIIANTIPGEFANAFDKAPTEKNKNRTLIEKHVNDFISRNTFDYFIHKDLGGFLRRELDFYIKNEVLFIDDINTESPALFTAQLSKIKALKTVADKIITFLAQIEDFQKKLWLKKKFIISTDYCFTIDRIPAKYYEEIVANKAQLAEWIAMYNVTITSAAQLADEPFLVVDTKHYAEEFKDKLLAEFDNLDKEIDGLLINSENFQALNVLQEKYQENVQQIYIDPPYNTGNDDGFVYKDNFQKSSWLSLMYDRIQISNSLLKNTGTFSMSIDLKELDTSLNLLNNIFGEENRRNNIAVKRSAISGPKVINPGVVNITENILLYSKSTKEWKENKLFRQRSRDDRYSIFIQNINDPIEDWKYISILDAFALNTGIEKSKLKKHFSDNYDKVLDEFVIDKVEHIVRYANLDEKSVSKAAVDLKILSKKEPGKTFILQREGKEDYLINNGNVLLFYKHRLIKIGEKYVPGEPLADIWDDALPNDLHNEGGVYLRKGKKPEKLIDRVISIGCNTGEYVLDYFAGSGTTGAVALKSDKKFINVEQGIYFDSITLKRIKNTLNGERSGVTKLYNWIGGGLVKYQILESYEDTLNNLYLAAINSNNPILSFDEQAQEEYLLHYMLDIETRDHLFNIEMFRNPFNYQLKVTENNELIAKKVDLVETFNYLIGIYVERIQRVKDIKLVEGTTREGQKTLVIWRNTETTTNEETEKVFRKLYDSTRTSEFNQIYINGDHHFENIRQGDDTFKVKLIEDTFFKKMFNISEL